MGHAEGHEDGGRQAADGEGHRDAAEDHGGGGQGHHAAQVHQPHVSPQGLPVTVNACDVMLEVSELFDLFALFPVMGEGEGLQNNIFVLPTFIDYLTYLQLF